MNLKPVVTQYILEENTSLERSTYQVSQNGSDYLFLLEDTKDEYRVDYRKNFSHYDQDPRYFRENQPETFSSMNTVEELFSEILDNELDKIKV